MSLVVVVKVSEGLVLAADRAATIQGTIETPNGPQQGILKTYYNARKLLQIGDFPIGVLTWGQAIVGMRTIESIVRQWEYDEHWQSMEDYKECYGKDEFSVEECAEHLRNHVARVYREEFGDQTPLLGILVAGYSYRGFFPEIWRFLLPEDLDNQVHNQRPDVDGQPAFGASWYGATDAIVRLHFGRDERALQLIADRYELDLSELMDMMKPLEYSVPFPVMPLQDAIEYAEYLVGVSIGRYRFVIGPEICGGDIDIAAITENRFNWIKRKTWSLTKD